ncbi:IS200/IS605 family accessory protein TnpB-related protein [Psychrobacillus sp. FJAT-51614]|uniref:IS200/IS605 family accessory protein TnpB-related protein n=1 Tax=Psychrobacillus mangrovi TaxID=3117745 RepID=A0ABU8F7J6_9BACI
MFQTYQTKLKNEMIVLPSKKTATVFTYLNHYAQFFGMLERKLFVDLYIRKKNSNELKKRYCAVYEITSRQYNSIKNQLDGLVKSLVGKRKFDIEELKDKIKSTEELIQKKMVPKEKAHASLLKMKGNEVTFLKKVKNYRSLRNYIHQKKRKLYRMQLKLEKLMQDASHGIIRLCFGSSKLFHKQFHLTQNNLTFDQWKMRWREARASQFTFIGSKDETFGNQTCTYDTNNNLRIRVSAKDEKVFGKYVVISHVSFPYGQEKLDIAKIPTIGYSKGKGKKTTYYRALTSKFIRKEGKWYLYMTVDVDMPTIQTVGNNGYIGVDFNVNFLAVTEVDRFGNYLHSFHVPFQAYHVSSEQAKQSLSNALKVVVDYALAKQKPIAREELNFQKKKLQLKQLSKKQAKMLSGFPYSNYKEMLNAKCKKAGVDIKAINPAYTSQIGQHKFMKMYGISSHQSAAMVIARKAMRFNKLEKVPASHLLTGNKRKIVSKKRFLQWKEVTKQWKKYSFHQKNYLLYKTS